MAKLLNRIKVYTDSEVRDMIAILVGHLQAKGVDFSKTAFLPIGDTIIKSSRKFLYDYYKDVNALGGAAKFKDAPDEIIPEDGIETLVFVDDFIGGGSQAHRYFKTYKNNLRGRRIYYLVFLATKTGYDFLNCEQDLGGGVKVNVEVIAATPQRLVPAFSDDSEVFIHEKTRLAIREIVQRKGEGLFPSHPLGYGDSQALVVFPHNTPNNTLPIIWAGELNKNERGEEEARPTTTELEQKAKRENLPVPTEEIKKVIEKFTSKIETGTPLWQRNRPTSSIKTGA